jgi:AraC-like DNA-binding protein
MPDVSHWAVRGVLREARAIGVDCDELCSGTGLERVLERKPSYVTWSEFATLLDRIAALTGGPDGLRALAQRGTPRVFERLAPTRFASPFVLYRIGVQWLGPSLFRCTTGSLEKRAPGKLVEIVQLRSGYWHSDPFFQMVAGVIRSVPTIIGRQPARVQTTTTAGFARYEIDYSRADDEVLDDDFERGEEALAEDVIEWLDRPNSEANPTAGDPGEALRQSIAASIAAASSNPDCRGLPTADEMALRLGTSVRTLKRRLMNAGTSFHEVRDDVLRGIAVGCLEQGESIATIARKLGYSESSALSRAFQRWTGIRPSSHRRGSGGPPSSSTPH